MVLIASATVPPKEERLSEKADPKSEKSVSEERPAPAKSLEKPPKDHSPPGINPLWSPPVTSDGPNEGVDRPNI